MESLANNQEMSTFCEKAFVSETPSSQHNRCSSGKDFHRIAILLYYFSVLNLLVL